MSGPASQPLLQRGRGLAKRYGASEVLKDVSFHVSAGSITGVIGVNGAGKSTTLKCIMGILEPDAGHVALFGGAADFKGRSRIGFLAEEPGRGDPGRRARAERAGLRRDAPAPPEKARKWA